MNFCHSLDDEVLAYVFADFELCKSFEFSFILVLFCLDSRNEAL